MLSSIIGRLTSDDAIQFQTEAGRALAQRVTKKSSTPATPMGLASSVCLTISNVFFSLGRVAENDMRMHC